MKKPGNRFAIAKMWIWRKKYLKKDLHIYLKIHSACANQAPDFFVRGTSIPNGLFQTINGLKRLMGYSKQVHQL